MFLPLPEAVYSSTEECVWHNIHTQLFIRVTLAVESCSSFFLGPQSHLPLYLRMLVYIREPTVQADSSTNQYVSAVCDWHADYEKQPQMKS